MTKGPMMLTKLSRAATPAPISARAAASVHPLPDLGSGTPAGVPGTTDRGAVGTVAPIESAHRMPDACYVCGDGPHSPVINDDSSHDYWSNTDATRHFGRLPDGTTASMTAVETLDPREAVHGGEAA